MFEKTVLFNNFVVKQDMIDLLFKRTRVCKHKFKQTCTRKSASAAVGGDGDGDGHHYDGDGDRDGAMVMAFAMVMLGCSGRAGLPKALLLCQQPLAGN